MLGLLKSTPIVLALRLSSQVRLLSCTHVWRPFTVEPTKRFPIVSIAKTEEPIMNNQEIIGEVERRPSPKDKPNTSKIATLPDDIQATTFAFLSHCQYSSSIIFC